MRPVLELFTARSVAAETAIPTASVAFIRPELVTLTAPLLDFNTSPPPLTIVPVPKLFTVSRPSVTIAMLLA